MFTRTQASELDEKEEVVVVIGECRDKENNIYAEDRSGLRSLRSFRRSDRLRARFVPCTLRLL